MQTQDDSRAPRRWGELCPVCSWREGRLRCSERPPVEPPVWDRLLFFPFEACETPNTPTRQLPLGDRICDVPYFRYRSRWATFAISSFCLDAIILTRDESVSSEVTVASGNTSCEGMAWMCACERMQWPRAVGVSCGRPRAVLFVSERGKNTDVRRVESRCRLSRAPGPHLHGSNRDVALLPPPVSAPPVGYHKGWVRMRHGCLCVGGRRDAEAECRTFM
jgi:hypothetical protein